MGTYLEIENLIVINVSRRQILNYLQNQRIGFGFRSDDSTNQLFRIPSITKYDCNG